MNNVTTPPQCVVANGFIEDRASKQRVIPVAEVMQALPVSRVVSLLKATQEIDEFLLSCCEDPVFFNQLLDDLLSTPEFPVFQYDHDCKAKAHGSQCKTKTHQGKEE